MIQKFVLALFLLPGIASAAAADDDLATVRKALQELIPGQTIDSIEPAPLAGLYEVRYGTLVFYVSKDGRYVVRGDVLDLQAGKNLTEDKRALARVELLKQVNPVSAITFAPRNPKHTVTVFTDIDCHYCRKLHSHMADYNREGIAIRYLAFPRSGVNTPSYYKAVSVWCADDRQTAMTAAKSGKKVAEKSCDNPVQKHMALAAKFNVTGTPTIILEDGTVLPGYVGARQLAHLLDENQSAAKN